MTDNTIYMEQIRDIVDAQDKKLLIISEELTTAKNIIKKLEEELNELRHEKRLWLKVCRFEKKRQEKFYDMMFIDQKSDFGMYLAAIKELAEDEE